MKVLLIVGAIVVIVGTVVVVAACMLGSELFGEMPSPPKRPR